jgi:hypothetical protein
MQYDVTILSPPPPMVSFYGSTSFENTALARVEQSEKEQAIRDGYFDPYDVIVLDEVTVEAKRIKNEMRNRLGTPDRTITSETMPPAALNVFELLRGRFAGVRVTGSPLNPSVNIRGGGQPLYILDGIQVPKMALLMIPAYTIESIELFKGPSAAIYGAQGSNGVLAFYTKSGYQDFTPKMLGMKKVKIRGYDKAKVFYSPDYGITTDRHNLPDHRSTLYWNPLVVPDATGHAVIEFYTSDLSTDYEVRIEGITINGTPAVGETTFSVQPSTN